MSTRQHPSVLNLLALDVSGLASIGLDSIAKVLCRSNLEHLNIVCTRVDSQLSKHIPNVLSSIQWESLRPLVLSGACIDEWLQLLPSPAGTQLLCLQIRGTSPHIQELSHTSILVIQQLIFASPLVELNIESAQLQEHRDWWLMVDSMNLSLLKTLNLGQASFHQLMSTTDAVDYFVSRIKEEEEAGKQGTENAKVTLPAFTLDVITLSEQDFVNIQKALRLSNVKLLYFKCLPFDHQLSDRIVHLLGAVQWSTLETLQLVGDNLDQWVQLVNKIDAPRLRRLDMWGSESVQQELTRASVSFVQQVISSSPLEEMNIGLVQLQDTQDWVRLVESMEPMLLRKVSLSGSSYDQFMTNTEAVDLDNLKRTGQTKVE